MRVTFVGVGEAFDEHLSNTSILVETIPPGPRGRVLLDCGFTAPHDFWKICDDPMALDAVWISHFHGDHFFGLPLLLLRYWEETRKKALTVVGQKGVGERIQSAMEMAYPGFLAKAQYPLRFEEVHPGKDLSLAGFQWSFAENDHSKPCLAVRLEDASGSVFYSGDGSPTIETRSLAKNCDLVIHEAYGIEKLQPGHGSVDLSVDLALQCRANSLALVHMNRDVRRMRSAQIKKNLSQLKEILAFLPEPGEVITTASLRNRS